MADGMDELVRILRGDPDPERSRVREEWRQIQANARSPEDDELIAAWAPHVARYLAGGDRDEFDRALTTVLEHGAPKETE